MSNNEENKGAIERLRSSRQEALKQLRQDGEAAGVRFALHMADYLQLDRLDRWRSDLVIGQTSFAKLACIMANEDGSEHDTMDWVHEQWGDDVNQPEWIEGFVEGALAKYHELRKEL